MVSLSEDHTVYGDKITHVLNPVTGEVLDGEAPGLEIHKQIGEPHIP